MTVLRQIKLLRKLDVPLEEIRRMQQGALTLTDGLRRHMIQLERQQQNLATMQRLCQELADAGAQLPVWRQTTGWGAWNVWNRRERDL